MNGLSNQDFLNDDQFFPSRPNPPVKRKPQPSQNNGQKKFLADNNLNNQTEPNKPKVILKPYMKNQTVPLNEKKDGKENNCENESLAIVTGNISSALDLFKKISQNRPVLYEVYGTKVLFLGRFS